jgi:hypothetical protein
MTRRKLSHIEHIVEGNIVYVVRLEGGFAIGELRSALARVQRKHPALRVLIREEPDGLYYEADSAPEIPLRVVPRTTEDDCQRECQVELTTNFASAQPLLRAVWLQGEQQNDLLFATSHRVCDGASMLIIVKEILRSLYADEELIPYEPITRRDLIRDYEPQKPWKRRLTASLLNGMLRLIPSSRRPPENNEHYLEWTANRTFSDLLKQRCKAEGVSVHAAFLVALDRTLCSVYGKKTPKWIENPVDIRRGRFAALKDDMVFFGGGNFKMPTGQSREQDFWTRARAMNDEIRGKVEQELLDIPGRFHFSEMLRPVTRGQIQSIVRLGDALKMNGSWNRFAFSNLGNVVITGSDAPFRVKDLRLYMHSLNFRALCLVTYTLNGEMRFYCVGDEKCITRNQAGVLKARFMTLLQDQIIQAEGGSTEISRILAAVAK